MSNQPILFNAEMAYDIPVGASNPLFVSRDGSVGDRSEIGTNASLEVLNYQGNPLVRKTDSFTEAFIQRAIETDLVQESLEVIPVGVRGVPLLDGDEIRVKVRGVGTFLYYYKKD